MTVQSNSSSNGDGETHSAGISGSNDSKSKPKKKGRRNGRKKQWSYFKGSEPKMNGHVFQCPEEVRFKKPNQFNRTVEDLRTHADKELKNSFDLYNELYEFANVKISAPKNLTTAEKKVDVEVKIFEAQCEDVSKR